MVSLILPQSCSILLLHSITGNTRLVLLKSHLVLLKTTSSLRYPLPQCYDMIREMIGTNSCLLLIFHQIFLTCPEDLYEGRSLASWFYALASSLRLPFTAVRVSRECHQTFTTETFATVIEPCIRVFIVLTMLYALLCCKSVLLIQIWLWCTLHIEEAPQRHLT